MPPGVSPSKTFAAIMQPPIVSGFSELSRNYDAALVDLWGCVHNGIEPYAGVLDCLRRMRGAGLKVLFLSNAPRPAWAVWRQLEGLGVAADCGDGVISSGDATVRALNRRDDAWHAGLGRSYYHLGPEKSAAMLGEIDDAAVAFEAADYIVNTGLLDDAAETPEDYLELLARAAGRGLPMVCANPDRVVMRGGDMIYCAGALAQAYEELSGEVRYHGKPHGSVYRMAFEWLGDTKPARVVMIGDSFATDIEGANRAGIDSIWLAGGIHGPEAGFAEGQPLEPRKVQSCIGASGTRPTWVMARLCW